MKISSSTCSSSSRRRRKKNSLVLLLLLCLVSTIQVATGCGVIFSRTSKDDDEMVIRQAAVVFAMDHTTSVHMHIQLFYEGASAKDDEFAWILPIPASDNTRVSLGTDVLFHSLAQATRPRFELEMEMNSKSCGSSSSLEQQEAQQPYACPFPKDAMSGNTPSSSAKDDTYSHTSGEEQAEEFSILSEFAILQAPNSNTNSSSTAASSSGKNTNILEWLAQNNYRTPPKTHSFIHYYAQQGHQFVALRFQPASTTRGEIQPIVVTFEKTPQEQSDQFAARLPMQWASLAGTNDNNYDIQVYFLANARVTPVNYLDVTLDDALHDWVGCYHNPSCHEDNYRQRFSQATGATGTDNQTQMMITEYAGNSSILDVAIPLTAIDLYEAENPLEFLQMLAHANVPSTPHVLSIIHQFLPPIFSETAPPFCQQLTTVYQDQGNSSSSTIIPVAPCLVNYHPTPDWRWDPIELAIQLEEHVFIPSKYAQATLQDYPYLTSLYTRVSSSRTAMNDAFFAFTTLEQDSSVSPIHRATASPQCRKSDGTPVALKISTHDDTRTSTATVPATVGCHGWFPTIPQPLDPQVATATEVTAWGVPRTGAWVTVSDYTYPVVEDVVILGNRTTTTTTITTTNSTTGQQDVVILGNGTTATLTTTTTSSTVILAAPLLLEPEQLQDEYPPQPMHQTSVIYREPPPESVIANSTEQEDDYRGQQVEQPPTTIPPRTSSPSTEQLVTLVDGKDVIGSTWPFSYASTEVSGAIKAECLCEVLVLGLTLAPLLWFF
ncbi:Uncharacterized protein conserved in bacteria (DUF2330) [Seminavis robusta]|uniref:Uncharacterized protein conserved in bacteria (DUF2330) n=1 Tax=Seminavis robusta TaxID=568900 RepID=A0A9N8HE46_9STRA|nr:Uncharacterized protein conserved in bacteria (DUF2330) [Seminavis robusta]|eukprot:Sro456_g146640.1 Uncharacterized protein conserved in bacteria (DUF2330) (776) ;mRNA; f:23091-25501